MRSNKKAIREYISKLVKQYIAEAEKEEAPADDAAEEGDDNPFAAAGGEEEGGGEEAAADDKGGDEKDKKEAKPEQPAGIPIKFNVSSVKKYNKMPFTSDSGVVKSIDKRGIIVTTQPDGVDVLVNFSDISENVKKFFKHKK
jgi:hypothetical protein